jgi:hypothetical protein
VVLPSGDRRKAGVFGSLPSTFDQPPPALGLIDADLDAGPGQVGKAHLAGSAGEIAN